MNERAIRHLYVRAPNWVGDLVMSTPVLEAAVAGIDAGRFERVSIGLRGHLLGVLAQGRLERHCVPLGRGPKGESEAAALGRLRPDAALLLSNSFGAAWRAFRAGVPLRFGSALSARRALLTHSVVPPTSDGRRAPTPTAHLLRDVAGLAGILVPDLHPRLEVSRGAREALSAQLSELGLGRGEAYALCCPGAAFGAAKLWPPEHFAQVLDGAAESFGWRAVVAGGPGEEALMDRVAECTRHGAISLSRVHRDLQGLKALVAGASVLVVGDSGPRWYAAAFDVPCVSVMGPNFPELTASSLEFAEVVRLEGLECAPCLERVCPLGHHRCMRELSPERVVSAMRRVLARRASEGP